MKLRQLTAPDIAIGLAVVLLVAAGLRPLLQARAHRALVEQAVAGVDALRAGALEARRGSGSWPASAPAGEVPTGLSPASTGGSLAFEDFTLEWGTVDVVEYVEALPREVPLEPDEGEELDTVVPPTVTSDDLPPDSVGPEMVPTARRIGAIVVHAGNESLLAELLAYYGTEVSYVLDTTWTLVVDDRAGSTP